MPILRFKLCSGLGLFPYSKPNLNPPSQIRLMQGINALESKYSKLSSRRRAEWQHVRHPIARNMITPQTTVNRLLVPSSLRPPSKSKVSIASSPLLGGRAWHRGIKKRRRNTHNTLACSPARSHYGAFVNIQMEGWGAECIASKATVCSSAF